MDKPEKVRPANSFDCSPTVNVFPVNVVGQYRAILFYEEHADAGPVHVSAF